MRFCQVREKKPRGKVEVRGYESSQLPDARRFPRCETRTLHLATSLLANMNTPKSCIFWGIPPCIPLKINWRFGGICRLHLQGLRVSQARNHHKGVRRHSCENFRPYNNYLSQTTTNRKFLESERRPFPRRNKNTFWICFSNSSMGVKSGLWHWGRIYTEGVLEQGAENIWTEERWSDGRLEKTA
jgi:hypothetical protein